MLRWVWLCDRRTRRSSGGVKSRVEAEKQSTLEAVKDRNVGRVAANSIPRFEKDKSRSIRYFFCHRPLITSHRSRAAPLLCFTVGSINYMCSDRVCVRVFLYIIQCVIRGVALLDNTALFSERLSSVQRLKRSWTGLLLSAERLWAETEPPCFLLIVKLLLLCVYLL